MLNTYLRLVILVLAVLVAIAVLHALIPLILVAAIAAALILGGMFLLNFLRKQTPSIRP